MVKLARNGETIEFGQLHGPTGVLLLSLLAGDEASCEFVQASCGTALLMNFANGKCVKPLAPKMCIKEPSRVHRTELNSKGVPNELVTHFLS